MQFGTTNYPSLENILSRIPELHIFQKYLGKNVREGDSFTNPLRVDNNPTCNFHRKSDGRLRMKDHAGYFTGDCVDLVMKINNVGYKKALAIIWDDFQAGTVTRAQGLDEQAILQNYHTTERAIFQVKKRPWDTMNLKYWSDYFIDRELLEKFNVYPIEVLWIGQQAVVQNERYRWDPNDPCYGYHLGDNEWKLYFPMRTFQRFLSNTNSLMGMDQLEDSDYLVITKSMKDIMVLDMFDVPSIAPHSEGILISELDDILMYYNEVFVLFDNDIAGLKGTLKYRNEGVVPLIIPQTFRINYNITDISDYIKFFKYTQTKKLIDEVRTAQGR